MTKRAQAQYHRMLAIYHHTIAKHEQNIASFHNLKSIDPTTEESRMPDEPAELAIFRAGNYHGFCRAVGVPCMSTCAVCAARASQSKDGGGG